MTKRIGIVVLGLIAVMTLGVTAHAVPVVLSNQIDFNTIVTNDNQSVFTSAPITVTDGGSGKSATFELILTSLSGQEFLKLDGNTRLGIGNNSPDGFHVDLGNINGDSNPDDENIQLVARLLSKTGNVGDVGFNIDALGIRNCCGNPVVSWTSSVSIAPVLSPSLLPAQTETAVPMDPSNLFHSISSSDYSGTAQLLQNQLQYSDRAGGISFNVQLGDVPEPTTATLGLLGLAGLLVRRRRAA